MGTKHIIALSGGADSTAMALRLREISPDIDFEYVISPTGDELPDMVGHWQSLERRLNRPMTRIGGVGLIDLVRRERMIPNFRARFCTRILKIEPFIEYMRGLHSDSVMYVGLRADEDTRLGLEGGGFMTTHPMQYWGWNRADVESYLDSVGVQIPARTDCGCCFYQRLGEWRDLLVKHPDRYEMYSSLEDEMGHTFRSPSRDSWPADLRGLKAEFLSGRTVRATRKKQEKCRFCSM